jgi:hypothetical protein
MRTLILAAAILLEACAWSETAKPRRIHWRWDMSLNRHRIFDPRTDQ